jgi:anti-anti-sigma factor
VLDIRISDTNQVAIVEAQGRIDSNTAHELGSALTHVIDDGYSQIVLDIAGVDYMSSAGLREMVAASKKVQNINGDIRISRVTERVYEVMEIPGLHTIFQMFDSQAEAVNSF